MSINGVTFDAQWDTDSLSATADGARITAWTDSAGSKTAAPVSGGQGPVISTAAAGLGGHRVAVFDRAGTSNTLQAPFATDGHLAVSIVVVAKMTATAGDPNYFTGATRGYPHGWNIGSSAYNNGTWGAYWDDGGVVAPDAYQVTASTAPNTSWHVWTLVYDGATTATVYLDGTQAGQATNIGALTNDGSVSTWDIGGHGTDRLYGQVALVAVKKAALTSGERALVHSYVQDTYGISVSDYGSPLTIDVSTSASTIGTADTATLTASASGGSGTKTYLWTKVSGPVASFSASTSTSTTFTPTGGAGTYVLRCTVTDGSGTASADVTVTVADPSGIVTFDSITGSTGWTPSSGTVLSCLTDSDGTTFATSSGDPSALTLTGVLQVMSAPPAGQDLTVVVDCDRLSSTSGTIVGQLYEGASLRSTSSAVNIPAGSGSAVTGSVSLTFPAADLASVTSWASGLTLTLSVTAS